MNLGRLDDLSRDIEDRANCSIYVSKSALEDFKEATQRRERKANRVLEAFMIDYKEAVDAEEE